MSHAGNALVKYTPLAPRLFDKTVLLDALSKETEAGNGLDSRKWGAMEN